MLFNIEVTDQEIPKPEIKVQPGSGKTLNVVVKISGQKDQVIKFQVSVPSSSDNNDKFDPKTFEKEISMILKTVITPSPTRKFLNELTGKNSQTEFKLSDLITNTVKAYLKENGIKERNSKGIESPMIDLGVEIGMSKFHYKISPLEGSDQEVS